MSWTISGNKYDTLEQLRERIAELDRKHPGERFPSSVVDEWNALNEELEAGEIRARDQRVRELADDPAHQEEGVGYSRGSRGTGKGFDGALRTLERHQNDGRLSSEAVDRVDHVLRGDDADLGLDAKYIEAVGSEAYERAFAKLLRYGDGAVLRMTQEEQTAVQKTSQADELRVALAEGVGSGADSPSLSPSTRPSTSRATAPSIRFASSLRCGR